jgi:hypothetical protein
MVRAPSPFTASYPKDADAAIFKDKRAFGAGAASGWPRR